MRVVLMMVLATAFTAISVFGQTPAPPPPAPSGAADARTLQSILDELRRLRQDLQATSATVERMQLLLYRMRNQMDIVSHISQKWEEAHTAAEQIKFQRNGLQRQMKQREENLNSITDVNARQVAEQQIANSKEWLAQLELGEPEIQARELEAANELRMEKDKLNELQDQIDRLDKKLEIASLRP